MSELTYEDLLAIEDEHSILGPSGGDRWMKCPGSVQLGRKFGDTASSYADEGNFGHDISQLCRVNGYPAKHYIGLVSKCGRFTCDKAFADAIQQFLDYVHEFEADQVLIEERVDYTAWVEGGFGTLDDGRLTERTASITDLKMGQGVKVYAKDNTQMKLYALGVFQDWGHLFDFDKFQLNIVQPRLDHIDEWTISTKELLLWARDQVEPTAKIALGDDAPFQPGKHCQFCRARDNCVHRKEWMMLQMLDELDDLESIKDPDLMTNDQLYEAMSVIDLMRNWCNDIERRTLAEVQAGRDVGNPSYKLVAGRTARKWRDEADAEKALRGAKLKVKEIFPPKLISPPQAEKLLGKKHPILTEQVQVTTGKPVLVPPTDPRPSVVADISELDD